MRLDEGPGAKKKEAFFCSGAQTHKHAHLCWSFAIDQPACMCAQSFPIASKGRVQQSPRVAQVLDVLRGGDMRCRVVVHPALSCTLGVFLGTAVGLA